ncbi:MAG: CPBP family intramembrane metalloprotease [Bacteroidetes bacterium]|nr:CPBP family intramembrane metalloprotease [Bacteroidota bacterium]
MTDYLPNPLPRKQISPGLQFWILIGLLFATLIAGAFVGAAVVAARYGSETFMAIAQSKLDGPNAVNALWILQFFSTTLPILVTPLIFSYFIVREPDDYLKHHYHFSPLLILVVTATMLMASPLIEFLGNLNEQMVLPKALKGLEDWMKQSEKDAERLSVVLMQMPTFGKMMFDLIFIGLLTAIVEEILFRGSMQTVFVRWTKNIHAAVWITAILFSAFHLEFYGFLPRLLLGLLFGYFVAWSGSIWPAIIGHFVNNGTVVVLEYLYQNKIVNFNPDASQVYTNTGYWISFVATLIFLLLFWYISKKWHSMHYGEELD